MRFWLYILIGTFLIATLSGCSSDDDDDQGNDFELVEALPVVFETPVDIQSSQDGTERLFAVEQDGIIQVVQDIDAGNLATTSVFLDIEDRVDASNSERGLLGLDFHPDFANNGFFYVNYTTTDDTIIARYNVSAGDPNVADKNSELIILQIAQPAGNHNGGQLIFGPDGFLYIALGDGGDATTSQDRTSLLGSMLRIDVDNPSGGNQYGIPTDNPFVGNSSGFLEEIFAFGFRNPWRFSFDSQTGELWLADVGQNRIEEINVVEKGKNYGWKIMEGSLCFDPSDCDQSGLELPIFEYDHSLGNAIVGGFVYRGSEVPELVGAYIYADFKSGRVWALRKDGSNVTNTELLNSELLFSTFGVDQDNELFLCSLNGKVFEIRPKSSQ